MSAGLASGDTVVWHITVHISPSYADGGDLPNEAKIATNDTGDPDATNDTSTTHTTVHREIDLSLAKADDPDPVIAGNQLTYDLSVTNDGPSDAQGVSVSDALPSDLTGATFCTGSGC